VHAAAIVSPQDSKCIWDRATPNHDGISCVCLFCFLHASACCATWPWFGGL